MHYKTIVKMRYSKKNLLKFSNGHIHLILDLGTVLFLKAPGNRKSFYIFVFYSKHAFVCTWLKIANYWHFRKRKQQYATMFDKRNKLMESPFHTENFGASFSRVN